MMVVDLQGEKRGKTFLLTDPVIHSIYNYFGDTNRRSKGMYNFLKMHKCGDICKALKLHS